MFVLENILNHPSLNRLKISCKSLKTSQTNLFKSSSSKTQLPSSERKWHQKRPSKIWFIGFDALRAYKNVLSLPCMYAAVSCVDVTSLPSWGLLHLSTGQGVDDVINSFFYGFYRCDYLKCYMAVYRSLDAIKYR